MTPGQMLWHHRRGMTLDEISAIEGISRDKVYRIILEQRWATGEVVISARQIDKMRAEGLTIRQMATRHFCSVGCICKKIKKCEHR